MASLVLTGDTSGQVTIAAPAVAGTTTLTLPATSGTVLNDATVGVCRAWVNFNGTGTVAIRASFNASSITDNGTGDYTVNFTTAMTDANYAFTLGFNNQNNAYPRVFALYNSAYTASALRLKHSYTSSFGSTQTFEDTDNFSVAIFR